MHYLGSRDNHSLRANKRKILFIGCKLAHQSFEKHLNDIETDMVTDVSILAWSRWQSILRSRLWFYRETKSTWRPLLCLRSNLSPAVATYTRITGKLTGQWELCRDLTGHAKVGFCGQSFRSLNNQTTTSGISEYETAKPFTSIPGPKGIYSIPYIGTRLLFKPFTKYTVEQFGCLTGNLHDTYGPIVRFRLGPIWLIMLEDLSDIQAVFRTDDRDPFRKPVLLFDVYEKRRKVKKGLATSNNEEWRRLRTPLNTRMNRPSSATHYLAIQEQVAVDFADRLPRLQSSPAALQEDFFRFAAESIGVVCFNKRLGFLDADFENNELKKKLLASFKTIIGSLTASQLGKKILFQFVKDSFYKNFQDAYDLSRSYAQECIEEALVELMRKEREGTLDPGEPNLLLSLLMEKDLDSEDVLNMLTVLLAGGSDSTACGLQMFFYLLATNPDKQEKLAQEILGEIGQDGSLNVDVLGRLSYLKASVKESMRIFFPIPLGTGRTITSDMVVSGYQLPKGTVVGINNYRTTMNPNYFENPEQFLPERWLRGDNRQRETIIHNFAYLPFGFGVRNCIGRRFAEQEIYLAAVKVLQKYKISLQATQKSLETEFVIFRSPTTPICFVFTPRN